MKKLYSLLFLTTVLFAGDGNMFDYSDLCRDYEIASKNYLSEMSKYESRNDFINLQKSGNKFLDIGQKSIDICGHLGDPKNVEIAMLKQDILNQVRVYITENYPTWDYSK